MPIWAGRKRYLSFLHVRDQLSASTFEEMPSLRISTSTFPSATPRDRQLDALRNEREGMSRRLSALLLAILSSALVVAACGSESSQPEEITTTTATPVTTPAPTSTAAPTTTAVAVAPTGPEAVSLIALDYVSQPDIQVSADGGGAPETADTPLFLKVGGSYDPLLAPDGHQLTQAEWATAEGTATITCEDAGTRYDLEFSGLVPDGVYTIWHFPTTEPIIRLPSGQIENPMNSEKALEGGALGDANGDENAFTADADGDAVLNVLAADRGPIPKCTLVGGTFLVVLYHIDSQTWGSGPGPAETSAWHGVFINPPL